MWGGRSEARRSQWVNVETRTAPSCAAPVWDSSFHPLDSSRWYPLLPYIAHALIATGEGAWVGALGGRGCRRGRGRTVSQVSSTRSARHGPKQCEHGDTGDCSAQQRKGDARLVYRVVFGFGFRACHCVFPSIHRTIYNILVGVGRACFCDRVFCT